MALEEIDRIDSVTIDRLTEEVVLAIDDGMDWSASGQHCNYLQRKINRYVAFVESGEMAEQYPELENRLVRIEVTMRHQPDEASTAFLMDAKSVLEDAGVRFRWAVLPVV
ncbi:MAG TPA: DUF6572 domain-containing protein [Clostridia bacterium]|nr:DUF6572 domain-containing protein [Clostridia bacterium]